MGSLLLPMPPSQQALDSHLFYKLVHHFSLALETYIFLHPIGDSVLMELI